MVKLRLQFLTIFIILTIGITPASANKSAPMTSPPCNKNFLDCISSLKQKIRKTQPSSHKWFHQKLTLLDMLFRAQEYRQVLDEVDQLLTLTNLPQRIELHCFMYKVKLDSFRSDDNIDYYKNRVNQEFLSLVDGDPQSIIDYATFQLYTGNFVKGQQQLLELEAKFSTHSNVTIKKQIYTILAHLTHKLGDAEATLNYVTLAYDNAYLDIDFHYQLMTSYNVARALHFLKRDTEALPKLHQVVEQASRLNETSYKSLASLRLAEIYVEQNKLEAAKTALILIYPQNLLNFDLALYQKLKSQLANK